MLQQIDLAGRFTLPGTSVTLKRVGYAPCSLLGRTSGAARDVAAALPFCERRWIRV